MTLPSTILDAALVLGRDPPPSLDAAQVGLICVDRELDRIGLGLALTGADADAFQIPHSILVRRALDRAPTKAAELARMLGIARSAITRLAHSPHSSFGFSEAPRRAAIVTTLLRQYLRRMMERAPLGPDATLVEIIEEAAMLFGNEPPSAIELHGPAILNIERELADIGLRLAVVERDADQFQVPHCMLVMAAVERAEKRGERKARARVSRLVGIDRAVITDMCKGRRTSFGGDDSRARVETLVDHLRNPEIFALPPAIRPPGRPRKKMLT